MKSLLIALIVALALASNIDESHNLMNQIVARLAGQIPTMKNNLNADPQIKAEGIRKIVGRGFTSFKQNAEIGLYNKVGTNDLDAFIQFLKNNVNVPQRYEALFVEELSMLAISDFAEIVETNILFAVGNGGECKFVCVLGQRNEDGSTNWLVGDIRTSFTLAPHIIVIQQKKKRFLGFGSTKWKVIEEQRTLTPEQKDVLFTFFEITAFERFAEVLKISAHLK